MSFAMVWPKVIALSSALFSYFLSMVWEQHFKWWPGGGRGALFCVLLHFYESFIIYFFGLGEEGTLSYPLTPLYASVDWAISKKKFQLRLSCIVNVQIPNFYNMACPNACPDYLQKKTVWVHPLVGNLDKCTKHNLCVLEVIKIIRVLFLDHFGHPHPCVNHWPSSIAPPPPSMSMFQALDQGWPTFLTFRTIFWPRKLSGPKFWPKKPCRAKNSAILAQFFCLSHSKKSPWAIKNVLVGQKLPSGPALAATVLDQQHFHEINTKYLSCVTMLTPTPVVTLYAKFPNAFSPYFNTRFLLMTLYFLAIQVLKSIGFGAQLSFSKSLPILISSKCLTFSFIFIINFSRELCCGIGKVGGL
jgi:hypothetical protein